MTAFFVDENLPPLIARSLAAIFAHHRFRSAADEHLNGVDDVHLCADLAARDFEVIITSDRNQLAHDHERRALKDAHLHWIGLPPITARGAAMVAAQLSLIAPAVAELLSTWPEDPTALLLRDHVGTVRQRELI